MLNKQVIKKNLINVFGYSIYRKIFNLLKRLDHFSENDLIYDYFIFKNNYHGTMVDVGVHYGESLIPFLKSGWTVYGFEPDPENRKNIPYNSKRFLLSSDAVGEHEKKEVVFYRSEESSGISSLSNFRESHKEIATVNITTLKEIAIKNKIYNISFLKIDTEGHDLMVLKGYDWSLEIKPNIILCEFEDAKTIPLGYTFKDMADFLISKKYQVFLSEWEPITKYGTSHSWKDLKQYPCPLSNHKAWENLIAYDDEDFKQFTLSYINKYK